MDDDWSKNVFKLPQWFSDFSGMVLGALASVTAYVAQFKTAIAQQLAKVQASIMETKRNIMELKDDEDKNILSEEKFDEFVEHVMDACKDIQKAALGGPAKLQEAVGGVVKSSAGKLRELCPKISSGQIQDIITDVVASALGGDSMPAKAFRKARVKLAKFEAARDKLLGEAMEHMCDTVGLSKKHAEEVLGCVLDKMSLVAKAAFGGKAKLMNAAGNLLSEVAEDLKDVLSEYDLGMKGLSDMVLGIVGAALGGGKVAEALKKGAAAIEKIREKMAELLKKNLALAIEKIKELIAFGEKEIMMLFEAVKKVIMKQLSVLKTAAMKGAKKLTEAVKELVPLCQEALVLTAKQIGGGVEMSEDQQKDVSYQVAGAFMGGPQVADKFKTLHAKAMDMQKMMDEACDERIAKARLKIILEAPPPGIAEEAIDGVIMICRDGGLTGADKKYSNVPVLMKAAMRGKTNLLQAKDATAQKCIKFLLTAPSGDDFTEEEKEKIVEQVLIAVLGPVGTGANMLGCFKKKPKPKPPAQPEPEKVPEKAGKPEEESKV